MSHDWPLVSIRDDQITDDRVQTPHREVNPFYPFIVLIIYLVTIGFYFGSGENTFLYWSTDLTFVVAIITLVATRDIFHPFAMIPCVHGMYSTLPLVSAGAPDGDQVLATFGVGGGAIVFSAATLGIIASWCIYCVYAATQSFSFQTVPNVRFPIPSRVAWAVLAIGIVLTVAFYAIVGFSEFSASGYLERFQMRLTPGMGIFANGGTTLVTLSLCMFLTQPRLNFAAVGACLLVFLMNFAAQGSRSYFVAPALVCAAAYHYRIRNLPIFITLGFGTVLYFVFDFVGYVRIVTGGDASSNTSISISDYFAYLAAHFGQIELAPVYGTASAAYSGFIQALPHFGDYLLAWEMAVPQFLTTSDFSAANYRFALAFDPASSLTDMGWGFSLFGEAYLVMGIIGPVLVAAGLCLLAAFIYREARSNQFQGTAGIFWLSLIFFQIWAQRNAFAYFIKDWFVYEFLPVVLIAVLTDRLGRRQMVRPMP